MSGPEGSARPERPEPFDQPVDEDLGFEMPQPAVLSRRRVVVILAGLAVAGGVAFAIGYWPRAEAEAELATETAAGADSRPRVEVISATAVTSDHALNLTGTVTALEQTTLYPRVSGYVRRWLVDMGDKVEEGQLLAEIDVPETDAALLQGRAQLVQAQAALVDAKAARTLSQANLARYQHLGNAKLVAKADVDQWRAQAAGDEAKVQVAEANIAAQQANVRRLADTQGFARVTAPFGGIVTARLIDRGALVTDGNSTPLFRLSAINPVRVMVQVPQNVAPSVRVGLPTRIVAREYGDRAFDGQVTRSAGELDPALRTMTTEIRVPNPDGALMPGMYVQTALMLPTPHRVVEIPATALFNDAHGVRVAVVSAAGTIHFVPIVIERDTGSTIQVASGLEGTERIVKIAIASLTEGAAVTVAR
ncbi:MAG TPA: efflux RND transporter periplasmic adaptor subunit [Kofleriaceae bacterium]|nr:efflux RND transporter periplasmic adaptor subunit [Kofleriaceae bacterium]